MLSIVVWLWYKKNLLILYMIYLSFFWFIKMCRRNYDEKYKEFAFLRHFRSETINCSLLPCSRRNAAVKSCTTMQKWAYSNHIFVKYFITNVTNPHFYCTYLTFKFLIKIFIFTFVDLIYRVVGNNEWALWDIWQTVIEIYMWFEWIFLKKSEIILGG